MSVVVRPATLMDLDGICAVMQANAEDPSLFQRPRAHIAASIDDFVVAADEAGAIVGTAALHRHRPDNAEILAVSIAPSAQGAGIGARVVEACISRAGTTPWLWLSTAKPGYFARFGFVPISMFSLPPGVLLEKLPLFFEQTPARCLFAVTGGYTFMRKVPPVPGDGPG